ncbi:Hsp20/alpha crystallin family protein [Halobacterium sp. KA-6]|jgi:HSP20 family protein|uniref:Hsp20/alpha crystallin family protein n=1 Tax=Halobacterium sp. KA-6 TaxID=2896368 RepID=UPI001E43AF76|nr:Hsp20/alpha crystallin family protein [Halobacterium sp. KA-6]MCD2204460.1 Hsp20/alpha crystallin family protein [Halobacterium sp. KA-6]
MRQKPFTNIEDVLERMGEQLEQTRLSVGGEIATAAVDVGEWDGEFVVEADLPGYEREDIDVRVTDNTLHIDAEHKAEREEREELSYLRKERVKTDVSRTITLPEEIDEDEVSATYENGVLTVVLPKHESEEGEAGGHRVEIQ